MQDEGLEIKEKKHKVQWKQKQNATQFLTVTARPYEQTCVTQSVFPNV